MLDIEVIEAPSPADALGVVSLAEMKRHLRISPTMTKLDDTIKDAVVDAVDILGGIGGILNRTILPTTLRRYIGKLPMSSSGVSHPVRLPYGPVIAIRSVRTLVSGVYTPLSTSLYTRDHGLVPQLLPASTGWPEATLVDRGAYIEYEAGYDDGYPPKLKRYVKLLAAHYIENGEGTINEPRQMMINRSIQYGFDQLCASLRIPVSYDDWIDP